MARLHRKSRSHQSVLIANPLPGGARYTTLRHARELANRGIAAFNAAGHLVLAAQEWVRSVNRMEFERVAVDVEIARYRAGVCYWNGGCDPRGCCLPGWVRS